MVRVGDFYEANGYDAFLLVQHAGLNWMGNSLQAGAPVPNRHALFRSLTDAGLSVVVVEEVTQLIGAGRAAAKTKIKAKAKARAVAQVLTPASPRYFYGRLEGDLGRAGGAGGAATAAGEGNSPEAPMKALYVGLAWSVMGFRWAQTRKRQPIGGMRCVAMGCARGRRPRPCSCFSSVPFVNFPLLPLLLLLLFLLLPPPQPG